MLNSITPLENIDQHIKLLLSAHDCVILPDFGAFIADYKAASIDQEANTTPRKSILFNSHLHRNDGLLINALVENEDLNYEEAKRAIQDYILHIKQVIENRDSYHISGIGTFQLDSAGFIQFNEDDTNECHLDTYGLPSIKLRKIKRQVKQKRPSQGQKILDHTLKLSAAVVLIFVVFYVSKPSHEIEHTDKASFDFISDTPSSEIAKDTITNTKTSLDPEITRVSDTAHTGTTTLELQYQAAHHVIIGSLPNKAAAQLHLRLFEKEYPFEDIKIIEGQGRYRISASHFDTKKEALDYIKTLQALNNKTFKDAWTLYQ